eukprot:TRINITY_DN5411_c2_g1_i1.p1 TRINITY_DN5411_c2_g1~~TRINITY_DN5411_c2_g1_i1.p1  ORF type:complete len:1361 (+),score=148.80 TRINITY_DN5411_c2_g1_i1:60-4142(+)
MAGGQSEFPPEEELAPGKSASLVEFCCSDADVADQDLDRREKCQEPSECEPKSPMLAVESHAEERAVAEELLKGAQMRVECAKVCAPARMAELVEGANAAVVRLRSLSSADGLKKFSSVAASEHSCLQCQWQQRSGTIRVVVRVRPLFSKDDEREPESAVKIVQGNVRGRSLALSVRPLGRAVEVHTFRRLDYILGPDKDQDSVFHELRAMLPSAGPGGFVGPPQSACVLAYGQTGSGKTHTMHGGDGTARGLVPRVLGEIFHLASHSEALISLSAIEVYNDIAYDLLDGTRPAAAAEQGAARGFQAGRLPPPPGLNFRQGCAGALDQASSVAVKSIEEAYDVLSQAAERRSTRSTIFNATSSRSHSLVLVCARLPGTDDPALRLAFVDLAGSERLPSTGVSKVVAEESRHINMSLTSLGSVIHALRHRSNHLPFRACLMTRLLEPYFGASGRVLLCVCISPEQRHAQETLCSLNFADRASRAVLGTECVMEVQRGQALAAVREAYAVMRSMLRELLPAAGIGARTTERLPDFLAKEVLSYMPAHGGAAFVCRFWSLMCQSHNPFGRTVRMSRALSENLLQWLSSPLPAATVCRCWWSIAGAFRVSLEASSAKVWEASATSQSRMWTAASAKTRLDVWKALMVAGGGSGSEGAWPLCSVREVSISCAPKPEALKEMLLRCPQLRLADVDEPALVSPACDGLVQCPELRALRCKLAPIPLMRSLHKVLQVCRCLTSLVLTGCSDMLFSLFVLTEGMPKSCTLRELVVEKCVAEGSDFVTLAKCCARLRTLRLPHSYVESGSGHRYLSSPPLVAVSKFKHLRSVDFRACTGRGHQQRPWLTDNMFGALAQVRELREIRICDQKLLCDKCIWFLRRHSVRLRVLHLSGCRSMSGDILFSLLHSCENMESLRLPSLVIGQSERKLATGTSRWCQGLHCPRLRELCVDAWTSLEDAGVQMLASQCTQLVTVGLRQAPRLSNDAVTYLVALPHLNHLSLANCAGLADAALKELASASKLVSLDLSGCRQLTEDGVVEFSGKLGTAGCPLLRAIRLDRCPSLGRAAVESLASNAELNQCSLSCCRPLPEAAIHWEDARGHAEACVALGIESTAAAERSHDADGLAATIAPWSKDCRSGDDDDDDDDAPQCAVCLDEITAKEPSWQCTVCCNKLHDTEDCARGWLRLKQCCPTCRSAAWAPPPPEEMPSSGQARRRPLRAMSADGRDSSTRVARLSPGGFSSFAVSAAVRPNRQDVLPAISVSGAHMLTSQNTPSGSPSDRSESSHRRNHHGWEPPQSRRPPRPSSVAVTAAAPASTRLAAALAAVPSSMAPAARSRPARSSSLPPSGRTEQAGFSLVGLSIVGAGRG